MRDTIFYKALICCFIENGYCSKCPLCSSDDECVHSINHEILRRALEAEKKEDGENA